MDRGAVAHHAQALGHRVDRRVDRRVLGLGDGRKRPRCRRARSNGSSSFRPREVVVPEGLDGRRASPRQRLRNACPPVRRGPVRLHATKTPSRLTPGALRTSASLDGFGLRDATAAIVGRRRPAAVPPRHAALWLGAPRSRPSVPPRPPRPARPGDAAQPGTRPSFRARGRSRKGRSSKRPIARSPPPVRSHAAPVPVRTVDRRGRDPRPSRRGCGLVCQAAHADRRRPVGALEGVHDIERLLAKAVSGSANAARPAGDAPLPRSAPRPARPA